MKTILDFFTPKKDTFFLLSDSTIRQALEKFDYHKFSVVPVINPDGTFAFTISEGDILRYIKNTTNFDVSKAENVKINEIERYRSYNPIIISEPVERIIELAMEQNFIPVIDDRGMYIGILKRKTVIKYLLDK